MSSAAHPPPSYHHHVADKATAAAHSSPSIHSQHGQVATASYATHHFDDSDALDINTSSSSATTFPNLFADDINVNRRGSLALPRPEGEPTITISTSSSPPSSPYVSPNLPPKTRQGGMSSSIGEVTLPPLSTAVPMRRGAVSGASSGPSLPFPPIRLPPNEEDIPSRGPSPTLGKRPSFSLGHSNHVPPGPNAHLPMPALSGSAERRPGGAAHSQYGAPPHSSVTASYHGGVSNDNAGPSSVDYSRTGAVRMSDDGSGYYYAANGQVGSNVPRSANVPSWPGYGKGPRGEGADDSAAQMHGHASNGGAGPYNYTNASVAHGGMAGGHRADDPYYSGAHSHAAPHQHNMGGPNMHGARYGPPPPMYGRFEQEDSPYGMGARQMSYGLSMGSDDHLIPINGKRPRSAPRVLSSQPRIFACSQCPARFARNHDLKRHQRGHLSVRPYPCTWCGKSFSRKDALKRHVLVKGCGKDRKGDNNGGDSKGRKHGSSDENGSRSDAANDRDDSDMQHEDDQSGDEEEENRADDSQNQIHYSTMSSAGEHSAQQPHYPSSSNASPYAPAHSAYRTHAEHVQTNDNAAAAMYRWGKPNTMPSIASTMRSGDFAGAATSFAAFAAHRRPSASIA